MTEVHFHAEYLPNHHEFNVRVKFANKRLFEKMTIAKFLRFAREKKKPMIVDGFTIEFNGNDGDNVERAVRQYFRQVADAYVKEKYKNN